MAIEISYNGTGIVKPGAYSKIDMLLNGGMPLSPAGIVGLVGEAVGGAPGETDGVQEFDNTQWRDIINKYVEGPIVDMCRAMLNSPSLDPDITNGPTQIKIYKTNNSTLATGTALQMDDAVAPSAIFNLTAYNYGADGNDVGFYITEGTEIDEHAGVTSGPLTFPLALTPAGGVLFYFGGVSYWFTVPPAGAGPHATIDPIITLLNDDANWAPSRPVIATAVGSNRINLELNTALAAFDGYETMHEYGICFVGGGTADEELSFRERILFATNGTAAGTFTVNSIANLAVGMWTQIVDNDTGSIFVRITGISGAAAPYTITVDNGATNLLAYTVAQNARIYGDCSIVDPTTLEVTAGYGGWGRGSRGQRIIFSKRDGDLETLPENNNDVVLRILYLGIAATCTMTIQDVVGVRTLTTTAAATPAHNLNINLSNYSTVERLVEYINNFGGGGVYTCYTDYFNASTFSPTHLDYYNTIDIKTFPLNVKAAMYEILQNINSYSELLQATQASNIYGQLDLVSSTNRRFLSGGTNGRTRNTDVQNGFDALLAKPCNIVLSGFSQDATDDIADGLTDANSTYTIASINAMISSHCATASNTLNKSERLGYCSLKDTYANSTQAAKILNSQYVSLIIQDCQVVDANGDMNWKNPHVFAALCAGAEGGAEIGLPLTRKAINCNGIRHSDFDPKTMYADAIRKGILFAEQPDKGGVVVVCGNTTYMKDANFAYNRRSVMRAAFYTVQTMRDQLETAFVGKTKAAGDTLANAIRGYAQTILGSLLRSNILAADSENKGLGYRNLTVSVSGSVVTINVIITPVSGIDFVLNNVTLAPINDAA